MKRRDLLLVEEIRTYIDSHLYKPMTIHQLCKRFGMNRSKLQHGFQAITGRPVRSYMIYRRMELAAARLQETDDPIKTIAIEFGYKSLRNFSKAFKLFFQLSPTEYRTQVCSIG